MEKCLPPLEPVKNGIIYRDDYNVENCAFGYGNSSNRKECILIDTKKYSGCVRGSFDIDNSFTCTLCDNGWEIDPNT